jgi:hypothetical protein
MASIKSNSRKNWLCGNDRCSVALPPEISRADESGISFWLPDQYGSLAAVPQTPGWALGAIYYHTTVAASGNAAAAREIQVGRFSPNVNVNLNLNLNAQADLVFLAPSYTFATPVLGGQPSVAWRAFLAKAPRVSPGC